MPPEEAASVFGSQEGPLQSAASAQASSAQGAIDIFGAPADALNGVYQAPTTTQPYVLGPNQTGGWGDNSAISNPFNSIALPVINVDSGDSGPPKGVLNTSGEATDEEFDDGAIPGLWEATQSYLDSVGYDGWDDDGGWGDDGWGYGGWGYGGDDDFGDDGPVVLDLTGQGINITPASSSNMFYDMAGDGYQHRTAWAGAGNGTLVLDTQGDGKISQQNQIDFMDWDPTAKTDMQALLDVFDTNHNGKLDSGDAQFAKFKIMVTNADGTTTLETLAQAGVASINLTSDKTSQQFVDGSSIDGETTYTKTGGGTGTAATVSLAYDANGYAVKSTTTHVNGQTVVDNKSFNADGSLAQETISTTSADGLSETITFDTDGDGVVDETQTRQSVTNGITPPVESVTNVNAAGVVLNVISTTKSADGKTVTISRDADGNGTTDQSEVDATNADGSKSVTIKDLSANGTVEDSQVYLTSADGQTGTTKTDLNGDGVYDETVVDGVVTNSDGSRTETIRSTNADNSLRDKTVVKTSADGSAQTTYADYYVNAYDLVQSSTIVVNADGSKTTTQIDKNADGTTRDQTITTISADGLTTTTAQDVDGNGVTDLATIDATVVNADGSRTETISHKNAAGKLLDATTIKKGADGVTRTTSVDSDGDGKNDRVDQIAVGGAGAVTETLTNYSLNGLTTTNKTVTTTSADGLTKTVQVDVDGGGTFDNTQTIVTVKTSGGGSTVTTTDMNSNNQTLDKQVVTTSANGLSITTQSDIDGDGTFDFTTTNVTVVNSDGSLTTTVAKTSEDGTTLQAKSVTTISADRQTTTVKTDADGDGVFEKVETTATQAGGSTVDTVKTYSSSNTLLSTTTTTQSASGLSTQVKSDFNSDGTTDQTTTDTTVLNNDGSRTETVIVLGPNNAMRSEEVTTTDALGLSKTVQSDVNGDGVFDLTTTDVTVLNSDNNGDGVRKETITQTAPDNSTLSSTAITTPASGLSVTTAVDSDGDGRIDVTTTDVTTLNSDGAKTEMVSKTNSVNALIYQAVTNTSADRKTVTTTTNIDGAGTSERIEKVVVQPDGIVDDNVTAYDSTGKTIWTTDKKTAANGLSWRSTLDSNANNINDETKTDSIAVDANGNTIETYSDGNGDNNIMHGVSMITTTTSADGLTKTTDVKETTVISVTGSTVISRQRNYTSTDTTVVNVDGSTTETRTIMGSTNGATAVEWDREVTTVSAHGLDRVVKLDIDGDGDDDIIDETVKQSDGSTVETQTQKNSDDTLREKDVTTTSVDGRTVTVQRDTDGDQHFDQYKSTAIGVDGSKTDSIWTTLANETVTGKTIETTSADGRSQTIQFDTNGDGVIDQKQTLASVVNADGSTTETRSDFNSNGTLRDRTVTMTSANGFSISGSIDLDGDGVTDETFSNNVVVNADGSKTATVQTLYPAGTLKSQTITTTSANGLVVKTAFDFDGDGHVDISEGDVTASSGVKTSTVAFLNINGKTVRQDVTTTSADGLLQTVARDFNGDGITDFTQVVSVAADGTGSYNIDGEDPYVNVSSNAGENLGAHTIDTNGVDRNWAAVNKGAQSSKEYDTAETAAQESEFLGVVMRAYDAALDRNPTASETQSYIQYNPNKDWVSADRHLIADLTSSAEFTGKYGTLTDAEFIEQIFQNAYGRSASLSEMNSWLSKLTGNSTGRTTLIYTIAESAEHLADGDTHLVTNNSTNFTGTFTLDHTTDRVAIANTVDRLFETALDRHATSSEIGTYRPLILTGADTEAQVASALISSTEFKTDYGTLINVQFVKQAFQNALDRAPTSQESTTWTQLLTANTISRADLIVALADSPDHLAIANSWTSSSSPASSTSASLNSLVQAMAVTTDKASATSTAVIAAAAAAQDHQLAIHH